MYVCLVKQPIMNSGAPMAVRPLMPVVGGGPGTRFVAPPPRAGIPYQPVPTLPQAPPMMTMPQQMMRPLNSAPLSNNSATTMPHLPGMMQPGQLIIPLRYSETLGCMTI